MDGARGVHCDLLGPGRQSHVIFGAFSRAARPSLIAGTAIVALSLAARAHAVPYTFTPVTIPGISSPLVVGVASDGSVYGNYIGGSNASLRGFVYKPGDASATLVSNPNAEDVVLGGTGLTGEGGGVYTGSYRTASTRIGFTLTDLNGTPAFTSYSHPNAGVAGGLSFDLGTTLLDYDPTSSTLVGTYANNGTHSFKVGSDLNSPVTLTHPSANNGTRVVGISDGMTYGYYYIGALKYGFTESNGAYTSLSHPDAYLVDSGNFNFATGTQIAGIDGSTLYGTVDTINGTYSFLYANGVFTTIDQPARILSASGTTVYAMVDNQLQIGVPIPEPTTFGLASIAAVGLLARRRR